MNKRITVILIVALLFLEGAVSLLADEKGALEEDTAEFCELTELPAESDGTPNGDGNGGGGVPG